MQEAWRWCHNFLSLLNLSWYCCSVNIFIYTFIFFNAFNYLGVYNVLRTSDWATCLHTILPHYIWFGRCWPLFHCKFFIFLSIRIWPFSITKTFYFVKRLSFVLIYGLWLFFCFILNPFWFINCPKLLLFVNEARSHSIAFLNSVNHSFLLCFWNSYTTTLLQLRLIS